MADVKQLGDGTRVVFEMNGMRYSLPPIEPSSDERVAMLEEHVKTLEARLAKLEASA